MAADVDNSLPLLHHRNVLYIISGKLLGKQDVLIDIQEITVAAYYTHTLVNVVVRGIAAVAVSVLVLEV